MSRGEAFRPRVVPSIEGKPWLRRSVTNHRGPYGVQAPGEVAASALQPAPKANQRGNSQAETNIDERQQRRPSRNQTAEQLVAARGRHTCSIPGALCSYVGLSLFEISRRCLFKLRLGAGKTPGARGTTMPALCLRPLPVRRKTLAIRPLRYVPFPRAQRLRRGYLWRVASGS